MNVAPIKRYETVFAANASNTAPTGARTGRPFRGVPVSRAGAFRDAGANMNVVDETS